MVKDKRARVKMEAWCNHKTKGNYSHFHTSPISQTGNSHWLAVGGLNEQTRPGPHDSQLISGANHKWLGTSLDALKRHDAAAANDVIIC